MDYRGVVKNQVGAVILPSLVKTDSRGWTQNHRDGVDFFPVSNLYHPHNARDLTLNVEYRNFTGPRVFC